MLRRVYVLVSNVLLVNLLIAMMSDSYAEIKENADIEWKFGRANAVLETVERIHPLPPPLSLPMLLIKFTRMAVTGERERDANPPTPRPRQRGKVMPSPAFWFQHASGLIWPIGCPPRNRLLLAWQRPSARR